MSASTYTQANGNGTIAWSISSQPGLSIGAASGIVSGTPTATGTFNTIITATDAGGCTGTAAVTITVAPNAPNQSATGVGNTQYYVFGVAGAPTTPAVASVRAS